jgi:hypothetical protein
MKEIKELVRQAEREGWEVDRTKSSHIRILALVPSVVARQVAPASTCATTALGLSVITLVDATLDLPFACGTSAVTALMWWRCLMLARAGRGDRAPHLMRCLRCGDWINKGDRVRQFAQGWACCG